ncbi:MAG TPA: hypothetical protein VG758_21120 [Hyphomicrobiaceae bacterium]|jgi:hypothetical protein|nr:hypothetical protein [Hyphomicrobiaceae bacterium]
MTKKQRTMLERLAEGQRMLPAQILDVPSARKLLQCGYATLEDDRTVKDRSRGGAPAQVLVITDDGRAALKA